MVKNENAVKGSSRFPGLVSESGRLVKVRTAATEVAPERYG